MEHIRKVMHMVDDTNEQIAYLRSCIIGLLVDECSRVFLENEESILNGTYSTPLISNICDQAKQAYANCSATAYKKIYKAKEVLSAIGEHSSDSINKEIENSIEKEIDI